MIEFYVKYPMGAGGGWLGKVLNNFPFEQRPYKFFHHVSAKEKLTCWVECSHFIPEHKPHVIFSGKYQFNFFCNHAYKFYHLSTNKYNTSSYTEWFKEVSSVAFGLCSFCNYSTKPFFDFEDLLAQPDYFYSKVVELQIANKKPIIVRENFDIARQLFLNSCINTKPYYENFDSPWWIMFVLGQLMDKAVYPSFDIGDRKNYPRVKEFVKDNYYQCSPVPNWVNSDGVGIEVDLFL